MSYSKEKVKEKSGILPKTLALYDGIQCIDTIKDNWDLKALICLLEANYGATIVG